MFTQFAATSKKCNTELKNEVNKLDGTAAEGTKVSGKFFRVWMDVKSALTGHDRKTILDSCEYGEDVAKGTYEKVFKNDAENLSSEQYAMIKAQHTLLVADHNKVKSMRGALVKA